MMLIDETVVHYLSAFLAPTVLGSGLGLRWFIQRRNGNGQAKRSDIENLEKLVNTKSEAADKRIKGMEDRLVTWIGDVERKQDEDRRVQSDIRVGLARLEGPISK